MASGSHIGAQEAGARAATPQASSDARSAAKPAARPRPPATKHSPDNGFESVVKPFLSQNCYTCHGNKKQENGLNLQSFQSFLTAKLTTAPHVASVKTSLTIRTSKDHPGVPVDQIG